MPQPKSTQDGGPPRSDRDRPHAGRRSGVLEHHRVSTVGDGCMSDVGGESGDERDDERGGHEQVIAHEGPDHKESVDHRGQPAFVQDSQVVSNAPSVFEMVTVVGPCALPLAMIESSSPLVSLSRAQ